MTAARASKLAAAASKAASKKVQKKTLAMLKRPAAKAANYADGLVHHPATLSEDFGKVRMHNSKKRSYIQICMESGRYECLWSAVFAQHEAVTPLLYRRLIDHPGWTKQDITAVKEHIALGPKPLELYLKMFSSTDNSDGDGDGYDSDGTLQEGEEEEPETVSQEF